MAEDTEKKFQSIMAKLFNSPKSSSSSAQKMGGQKRLYSMMESNSKSDKGEGTTSAAAASPPPCRPWDRGDLMRRVATFKSMKWFAKPKVMDAINCARRGWVNVDMDIIACEVCGARLQFSTPSTWSQQQVEKAALVFSLKLNSGHKLLCPWMDNACDENLAFFPPLPAPVLVDHYKERSASLLQLSALPVISASVIESMIMKSPHLEHFLKQSMAVECGAGPNGSSWTEYVGNEIEAVSFDSYYQAHRLLSLCGWEPRLLPYMVDCGDQRKEIADNTDLSCLSHVAVGGPPPTKQNFRATVSLPVVGRNVRARFSSSAPRNIIEEEHHNQDSIQSVATGSIGLLANEETGQFNEAAGDSDCPPVGASGTVSQDNAVTLNGNSVELSTRCEDDSANPLQRPTDDMALIKDISSTSSVVQKDNGVEDITKKALQTDASTMSIDSRKPSLDRRMEFHPIRQHRHFCPWVTSTGTTAPGWQQTLSALQKEKVFSLPESDNSPSPPSLIKVDDPITSIRKLFESPPAKRAKPSTT